jgi:hypothetical protein
MKNVEKGMKKGEGHETMKMTEDFNFNFIFTSHFHFLFFIPVWLNISSATSRKEWLRR